MRQINGEEGFPPFSEPQKLEISVDGKPRAGLYTAGSEPAETRGQDLQTGCLVEGIWTRTGRSASR